jgi:hypothetical protein
MALRRLSLASVVVCAVLSGTAFAQTVRCTMDQRTNAHYIAPEITLTLRDYGEISVRDAIIASTGLKLVHGTVSKENASRITLVWEVRNVPADPAEVRRYDPMLQVRLTIQKQGGAATMTIADTLYSDFSYRGTGTCAFEG